MKIEKTKTVAYSNSGKTRRVSITLTSDETKESLELHRESEPCNDPAMSRKIKRTKLEVKPEDEAKFIAHMMKIKQDKSDRAKEVKAEVAAKQLELDNFLNSELLPGVKFDSIYHEVLNLLHDNGDFTQYHFAEIALVCLSVAGKLDIVWSDEYNSKPKLRYGHVSLQVNLNEHSDGYSCAYDVIINGKVQYVIIADDALSNYYYSVDFTAFKFQVQQK